MNAQHPETVDLLELIEPTGSPGTSPDELRQHLEGCEPCRLAFGELRASLDVEARLVAPPTPLETERALASVLARAHAGSRRRWAWTLGASLAAAVFLALLMPAALGPDGHGAGPSGGGGTFGAPVMPARDVEGPNVPLDMTGLGERGQALVDRLTGQVGSSISVNSSATRPGTR